MKHITGFSVLCLAAAMFVGSARAADPAPTASLPTLATGTYVELAYDSLDNKKQDKLSNSSNIKIVKDSTTGITTANLDLSAVADGTDGTYVLTATKDDNNQITLKWELITRTTAN
ncbi:MAG: hypothetical protein MJ170_00080 [Alphaproteobacteria bacterium]|nr:hypothetical protein [Alphaproteobacteria bacterium]